jgi:hypothetical protein
VACPGVQRRSAVALVAESGAPQPVKTKFGLSGP